MMDTATNIASSAATAGTHLLVNGVLTTATHGAIDAVATTTKVSASFGISAASWIISTAIITGGSLALRGAYNGTMFIINSVRGTPEEPPQMITASPSMGLLSDD